MKTNQMSETDIDGLHGVVVWNYDPLHVIN
jgi:hypothetical protein